MPNVHFAAALYGLPFAERPIAILKGYRTVKGTIIFCRKLRLVITRNGFCADTKPTFHYEERLFTGKTPLPQDAEWPVLAELPPPHHAERPFTIETTHSAKWGTTFFTRKRSFGVKSNDLCSQTKLTRRSEERVLTAVKSYSTLKIVIKNGETSHNLLTKWTTKVVKGRTSRWKVTFISSQMPFVISESTFCSRSKVGPQNEEWPLSAIKTYSSR